MAKINCEITTKVISLFIRDFFQKNGFNYAVIGVSGGIDSAVALDLTSRAIGNQNTFALLMPFKSSSSESLIHGKLMCEKIDVDFKIVDISPAIDSYFSKFPTKNKILIGNKCARERMSVLYDFSERKKALVVGTSNKSELLIGYSTLFGDSAAALLPIGDLYKTEIYELAEYLNIPKKIIEKNPSADLWKDQTDEGEIGMTYKELDEILFLLVDKRIPKESLKKQGFSGEKIDKIWKMIVNSQFKRTLPQVTKIHSRTIGMDFRYPRDWNR